MKKTITMIVSFVFCCLIIVGSASEKAFAASSEEGTKISLEIKNELIGSASKDENEAFTFQLTPIDGAPMTDSSEITIIGSSTASFGDLSYTKPGIYEYIVTPVSGGNNDIQYDITKYKITVLVRNKDGQPDNGLTVNIAAIENIETGEKTDHPLSFCSACHYSIWDRPQTGDYSRPWLWATMLILSSACVIYLTFHKKKYNHE